MRSYWLLGLVLLAACQHAARVAPRVAPESEPKHFLTDAHKAFRHGNFARALVAFRQLQFELAPGDPLAAEAHYYSAECSFQTGDFAAAALAFQKVAEEFPNSDFAALALLRNGDANMRLWRRPDVDASNGQTALAIYQELLGRYPGTDAAVRAQVRIRQLNEWFAAKSYKIALFYLRRRAYDSGIIYFKDIVANYPDTRLVPDALLRLVDTYRAIGYAEERKETCANLRRYYPQAAGLNSRCPVETSTGSP